MFEKQRELGLSDAVGTLGSVERLELVGFHRRLVLVEMRQRILCAVMMSIIVGIYSLGLKTRNSIEFLDSGSTQTSQRTEDRTFDLCDLCILNGIHQGVLGLGGMVL